MLKNTSISYRPLRIGFCVKNGNISELAKVAEINSILWGGIFNAIIPVGAENNLDEILVKVFRVDILIPIGTHSSVLNFIEKHPELKWPRFHENFFGKDDKHKTTINLLDISHLVNQLWSQDFKFLKPEQSNCRLVKWKSNDVLKNLYQLQFGKYPTGFSIDYARKFVNNLRATVVEINPTKEVATKLAKTIFPIRLTEDEKQLKNYGGHRIGAGVYIGEHDNFSDLVEFWNIRAAGSFVTFLPIKNAKRLLNFTKEHISYIKFPKHLKRKPEVSIWYKNKSQSEIEETIKKLQIKNKYILVDQVSEVTWNGLNLTPTDNRTEEVKTQASYDTKYNLSLSIDLVNKPLSKENDWYRRQLYGVSIYHNLDYDFPEYTLNLPYFPDLYEWYDKEITSGISAGLRVDKGFIQKSITIIEEGRHDSLYVKPVLKFDLVKKLFERSEIKIQKSNPGLIAQRLMALLGNDDGRIFKITGVRNFLEKTKPDQQLTKVEIINKIADISDEAPKGTFAKFSGQFGLKGKMPIEPSDVFEELIRYDVLKAGTELKCLKCGLKNWIQIKNFDDYYECEFCHEKNKFIYTTIPPKDTDGIEWSYRLNNIFSRSDNLSGALGVLLTSGHLTQTDRMRKMLQETGVELKFNNGDHSSMEIDLVAVNLDLPYGEEGVEIVISECKTGHRISQTNIDNLLKVRKLLKEKGIKEVYLAFTRLKRGFTGSEIDKFKKLVREGVRIILLTTIELEQLNPYWDIDDIPHKSAFDFSEIADNSRHIYKLLQQPKIPKV